MDVDDWLLALDRELAPEWERAIVAGLTEQEVVDLGPVPPGEP